MTMRTTAEVEARRSRSTQPTLWIKPLALLTAALFIAVGGVTSAVLSEEGLTMRTVSSYRIADTRMGNTNSKLHEMNDGQFVPFDVSWAIDDGPGYQALSDAELAGLRAVAFNITVTETEGAGYVQILAPGTTTGSTSTVNWDSPGQTIANSGITYVGEWTDEGLYDLAVHLGGSPDAGAHVIIDITGVFGIY